jgi:drug/metabolite transporter (DMT)-like permease
MEDSFTATADLSIGRPQRSSPSPLASARLLGISVVLVASLIWAIEPILVKLALRRATLLDTSLVRAGMISLVGWLYTRINRRDTLALSRGQWSAVGYIALSGTLLGDLLYLYSLTQTSVLNAMLIGHMQPLFILLLGLFLIKGEVLKGNEYLGMSVMLCAGTLVTSRTLPNLLALRLGTFGDLVVLLATLAWASAAMVTRKYLSTVNAGRIVCYRFFLAFVVLSLWRLFQEGLFAVTSPYQIVLGTLTGVGCLLYQEGLRRLPAAIVSSLELVSPLFSAILGFIVLGEAVTGMQLVGVALLVFGVFLLSKK